MPKLLDKIGEITRKHITNPNVKLRISYGDIYFIIRKSRWTDEKLLSIVFWRKYGKRTTFVNSHIECYNDVARVIGGEIELLGEDVIVQLS